MKNSVPCIAQATPNPLSNQLLTAGDGQLHNTVALPQRRRSHAAAPGGYPQCTCTLRSVALAKAPSPPLNGTGSGAGEGMSYLSYSPGVTAT